MDWFYVQMVQMHAYFAWFIAAVFAVRGLAALFDAKWRMDVRLLSVTFLAYGGLAVSGLSLWELMNYNPLRDGWFAGKLVALSVYGVCAHWAVGNGRFRAIGYVLSLLMLAYILGASMTRHVWLVSAEPLVMGRQA
jgi:uncharacterized membrane protein SirB2